MNWANDENWTRDLFLTKETLYHWATSAKYIKIVEKRAGDRVRTGDIQLGRLMLYQLSYSRLLFWLFNVGRAGFEPAKVKTNRFTVCPRWPLEYLPKKKSLFKRTEPMEGLEPTTCWLQISCSSQLSYIGLCYKKSPPLERTANVNIYFFKQNKIIRILEDL